MFRNPAFVGVVEPGLNWGITFGEFWCGDKQTMNEISREIATVISYYRQDSYLASNSFKRTEIGFTSDINPNDFNRLRKYHSASSKTLLQKNINTHHLIKMLWKSGVPAFMYRGVLRMYSSPESRRFGKALCALNKRSKNSLTVKVHVDLIYDLRWPHRTYRVDFWGEPETFWDMVKKVCETRSEARHGAALVKRSSEEQRSVVRTKPRVGAPSQNRNSRKSGRNANGTRPGWR